MHGEEFNIERAFISCLLEKKEIGVVREERITPAFFTGDNKTVFTDIYNRHVNSGNLMSLPTFRALFPKYKLCRKEDNSVGTNESIMFWIDALRKKAKHNKLADAVEDASVFLNEDNSEKAKELLIKAINKIDIEIEKSEDTNLNENLDVRRREYEHKKISQGIMGIPSDIPFLDYLLKGFQKETLTTMIAPTGVGKSWFEVLIACNAVLQGYKVIQGLTEMSSAQIRDRYEMILFAKKYGAINANHFKSGKLSPVVEKQYFEFLEEYMPTIDLPIFTAISPMQVAAEIDKHKPDLVLIDGVYLMEDDEKSDSDWLRIAHITRSLKKLSKNKHIAIFTNSQADKNTSKKIGAELGDISYSQAIGQDADNILALFRSDQMRSDREMCLKVLKNREGDLGKIMLSWDFSNMQFNEIYHEQTSNAENEGAEENDSDLYVGV